MMAGSLHDMHSKRNGDPKGAAPRFLVFTSAFLFRAERYAEAARSWALATMLEGLASGFSSLAPIVAATKLEAPRPPVRWPRRNRSDIRSF